MLHLDVVSKVSMCRNIELLINGVLNVLDFVSDAFKYGQISNFRNQRCVLESAGYVLEASIHPNSVC